MRCVALLTAIALAGCGSRRRELAVTSAVIGAAFVYGSFALAREDEDGGGPIPAMRRLAQRIVEQRDRDRFDSLAELRGVPGVDDPALDKLVARGRALGYAR